MDAVTVEQSELQCPNCAGQCVFSPAAQALACQSCGQTYGLETPQDSAAEEEFAYFADSHETDRPVLTDRQPYQCQSCGGEILFTGASLSKQCPYCDGAVVLASADVGYRTSALIPFKADAEFAQKQALAWVRKRYAAPRNLYGIVAKARVAGLYAPFWTFDSQEAVKYWAKYTKGSGDNRRTHATSGNFRVDFDDLLMPASPHVTPLIRDGILHEFNPTDLRPYRAGYLAGFAAERHHQSIAQGLAANQPDKKVLIRNRIKRHINKSGVHEIRFQTDTTGIHYRRVLLPVWILHYTYKDVAMKVVVSGIDGRTYGERPFSYWKIAGYAALISAVTIGFGLGWGAAGLL